MSRRSESSLGGEQVEGRRAVEELLLAGTRRVHEVLIAEGTAAANEIASLAREARARVRTVSRDELNRKARSEAPQGVIAVADAIPDHELQALFERTEYSVPFLLAFDGITDPHNLGALLRVGECAGVTGAIIPKKRSADITPTVAKASAGAVEHVPMSLVSGLPNALQAASKAGVWVVGLDPEGSTSIYDLKVADEPIVLVMGAEGPGLSRLVKERCDVLASIPQYGSVASLNVSAAGAIACFEVAHKRALSPPSI